MAPMVRRSPTDKENEQVSVSSEAAFEVIDTVRRHINRGNVETMVCSRCGGDGSLCEEVCGRWDWIFVTAHLPAVVMRRYCVTTTVAVSFAWSVQ